MAEHQHQWVKTGIHVPIMATEDGFTGVCEGSEDCNWSFSHPDKSAVRAEAFVHLGPEGPHA